MKTFLWRSLLIISFGMIGMYVGAWAGATFFVPKSAGLAGGAMVLGYALMGLVGFAIAGAVIAFRQQGNQLRSTALIVGVPVLLFYLGLAVNALMNAAADREPDEAFEPAGRFTITMERVDTSDPYLFVRMHVDSNARTWEQTGPAPDNQVCYATSKAKNLIEIRDALESLLTVSDIKLADCNQADQPEIKRLQWDLIDGRTKQGSATLPIKGTLGVNESCLRQHFEITRVFSLVEKISQQDGGKVRCK